MIVAVTGGRDHEITDLEKGVFLALLYELDACVVLDGDCRGVDRQAREIAAEYGYYVNPYPADWEKHGKAAGPIRNREMLGHAQALIVFPGGKGTADCVAAALADNCPVCKIDDRLTRRQFAHPL